MLWLAHLASAKRAFKIGFYTTLNFTVMHAYTCAYIVLDEKGKCHTWRVYLDTYSVKRKTDFNYDWWTFHVQIVLYDFLYILDISKIYCLQYPVYFICFLISIFYRSKYFCTKNDYIFQSSIDNDIETQYNSHCFLSQKFDEIIVKL